MKDFKRELLEILSLRKNKWQELQGKSQDVTQEDFVNNVLLVYDWVIEDIERIECCQ